MAKFVERPVPQKEALWLMQSGTHPLLARLFAARGISRPDELSLELKNLLDPQQLKNCSNAAQYLYEAMLAKKRLLIVADYDCDGATACAVGIRGLKALGHDLGVQVDYLVPNRFTFGYGLTPEVVEIAYARTPRPDILITVDNGIASIAGVQRANELGMAVLVTDHHLPADALPEASVIVNPNQPGCHFPSKSLAGVGVMFYVLIALRSLLRSEGIFTNQSQPKIENLLDLVALGTVADVASLDQNNRILVSNGLKRIRAGQMQPGIRALYVAAGRDPMKASAFDFGFALGPRLNAAGRLADMSLGIRCLLSESYDEALELAHQLDRMNRERRDIESTMQETALSSLSNIEPGAQATLCLTHPDWHQGVIGIVASRLKERFHRPTIVFAPATEQGKDVLKGSGRSITGFHLRDALDLVSKQFPELILKFGGHAMAAGLSIDAHRFDEFKEVFEITAQKLLDDATLERKLFHDGPLECEYIEPQTGTLLSDEVWGQGFPAPVFVNQFEVLSQSLVSQKHLKLQLKYVEASDNRDSKVFHGIWFGRSQSLPQTVRLAYRLVTDYYQGVARVQLHIEGADEAL